MGLQKVPFPVGQAVAHDFDALTKLQTSVSLIVLRRAKVAVMMAHDFCRPCQTFAGRLVEGENGVYKMKGKPGELRLCQLIDEQFIC